MNRFVILRHEMPGGERPGVHWDFMIEEAGRLRTWALEGEPNGGAEVDARQLADHRMAYLEYEGPISGGRGQVQRWDFGTYETLDESAVEMRLQLAGRRLNGVARLTRPPRGQRWKFCFSPEGALPD